MRKENKVLTIGIFAHANAGKTTITEHLLYHTNVIEQVGRVDNGNTVTDDLNVEKQRGITVRDTIVTFTLHDKIVQLIDTPGHVDFSAEVERAINVLDGAVLVISGVEGLEAQTYTIWRALQEKNVPVIIFINKMDRKGANYNRVVAQMQSNLKIPTLTLKDVKQLSDGQLVIEDAKIDDIIEEISLVDDEVLTKYVNGETIEGRWLTNKMINLAQSGKIFPVIGGSALIDVGIDDLIKTISCYLPTTIKYLEDELSAYVFMIRMDETGKNAYIKVLNGCISTRENININDKSQKVKNIMLARGAKMVPVSIAYSGDIAIINGLDVKCGQIIGNPNGKSKYVSFVKPLLTMEIKPLNQNQSLELMKALKILNEEDPYLNVRYNEKTQSIYCSLMGEVQAQIIQTLLEERFGIKVIIDNPIIIHKEIPTQVARASASYTCVSGIELEVSPLERGKGFNYVSKLSTDFMHLKYQRQIERLVNYYSKQGLNGWELTDMQVALIGGQFDSMGSDPMHFNIITPLALFRSLKKANMKLLEPILHYLITIPEDYLSQVIKLISTKSGMYQIIATYEGVITIEGQAPAANMLNFPLELSMTTSGRGTYTSYIDKYEISKNQGAQMAYLGPDPRNETTFIINDMHASLDSLDETLMKKKKESRSKYARIQKEKEYRGR